MADPIAKYGIDNIFAKREQNNLMPQELLDYCSHTNIGEFTLLTDMIKVMDEVTRSHSQGVNPNDVTLRNAITECLNKLTNKNYDTILPALGNIQYTSASHFGILATEIIAKCMNDIVASKSLDISTNGMKTSSELYVDVAKSFSNYGLKVDTPTGSKVVKFIDILSKKSQDYFNMLTDPEQRMDKNNPQLVSNYKGFMNMIGLMYCVGLFPIKIIKACFDRIIKLVLESDKSQEERDNYYTGYERLMNRLLTYYERSTISPDLIKSLESISIMLIGLNNRITSRLGGTGEQPLRRFATITHETNAGRLEKLLTLYKIKPPDPSI